MISGNFDQFEAELDAAILHLDNQVSEAFHNWTMHIFIDLVESTPQWSGDLAANWYYSLNSPSSEYHEIPAKAIHWAPKGFTAVTPLRRGDPFAVTASVHRATEGPKPTWRDKVYFTNNTPIAFDVENRLVTVRAVNLVDRQVAMASFIAYKWRNLPYDATRYSFA